MNYVFQGTQGIWSVPHFCDENVDCDCKWVLSEHYFGSIATINFSPDRQLINGDNPPLEQAIWNGKLISKAPELLKLVIKYKELIPESEQLLTKILI